MPLLAIIFAGVLLVSLVGVQSISTILVGAFWVVGITFILRNI